MCVARPVANVMETICNNANWLLSFVSFFTIDSQSLFRSGPLGFSTRLLRVVGETRSTFILWVQLHGVKNSPYEPKWSLDAFRIMFPISLVCFSFFLSRELPHRTVTLTGWIFLCAMQVILKSKMWRQRRSSWHVRCWKTNRVCLKSTWTGSCCCRRWQVRICSPSPQVIRQPCHFVRRRLTVGRDK